MKITRKEEKRRTITSEIGAHSKELRFKENRQDKAGRGRRKTMKMRECRKEDKGEWDKKEG